MKLLCLLPRRGLLRIHPAILVLLLIAASPCLLHAQAPAWWQQRGVLSGQAADDFAAINQGQLKNLVKGAVLEMKAQVPGGAGTGLDLLVAGWAFPTAETDDFAAVNQGQLKAAAAMVYDRLIAVGYTTAYPWTAYGTPASDHYAMANIGQAKNLFKFDFTLDVDYDGWTLAQEQAAATNPWLADTDGDGVVDGLDYAPVNPGVWFPPPNPSDTTPPLILILTIE